MNEDRAQYIKLGYATDLAKGSTDFLFSSEDRESRCKLDSEQATRTGDFLLYRALEIVPGALLWVTLIALTLLSWILPVWVSFFIIIFDVYWLLKTLFFSLHLKASFKRMREHMAIDWMERLRQVPSLSRTEPKVLVRGSKFAHSAEASSAANVGPVPNVSSWDDIYHLIILPNFREPREVIKDGLEKIVHGTYPTEKMIVVLAMEEAGGDEDRAIAEAIKKEYEHYFFKFLVTVHPKDMAGELAGKGSNETWAARKAKEEIIDRLSIPYDRIIVSSLDGDTQIYPQYFAVVTYHYLTVSDPLHSSYQPIPVYNNNIWEAHSLSRIVAYSGTFWQMMQQARPERLTTFSSHSMPWRTLVEMDFWHTNIVSEDSRIFWQALLFYDGNWKTVPLYYPVSMDANIGDTWWATTKNIYKQQRRWGWGVENVPYTLFGFLKNKRIPFRTKLYFTFNALEGFWSWSTNALIIFLFGWLPIILGGDIFNTTVLAYNVPRVTRFLMTAAMIGVISSSILSMKLLPPLPKGRSWTSYIWIVAQWFLMPFTLIVLGSFPGIDAQTRLMLGKYMGFWRTPKKRGAPKMD